MWGLERGEMGDLDIDFCDMSRPGWTQWEAGNLVGGKEVKGMCSRGR